MAYDLELVMRVATVALNLAVAIAVGAATASLWLSASASRGDPQAAGVRRFSLVLRPGVDHVAGVLIMAAFLNSTSPPGAA